MKKRTWLIVITFLTIMVCLNFLNQYLNKIKGFQIYLLEDNELVLSDNDILWYNKTSHDLKLTETGINKIEALQVPLTGSLFVVMINQEKLYNGSFVNPISSIPPPPSEVVIVTIIQEDNTIRIEKRYPVKSFDPRENSKLFEYFKRQNKLLQ
jgi:hypothetical protein